MQTSCKPVTDWHNYGARTLVTLLETLCPAVSPQFIQTMSIENWIWSLQRRRYSTV
uniref:Uncharacterized protein n=1 Tax=Arundo donax TaxID=35708 RepID=A0A0A9BDJ8_ARUDO